MTFQDPWQPSSSAAPTSKVKCTQRDAVLDTQSSSTSPA